MTEYPCECGHSYKTHLTKRTKVQSVCRSHHTARCQCKQYVADKTKWGHQLRGGLEDKYMPEPNTGCWLWIGGYTDKGYGRYGKKEYAHRAVYERTVGPVPAGMVLCHKCDVPICVNPAHMFLGTPSDNMQDMARKGRAPSSHDTQRKLTENDVRQIRELADATTISQLARQFKVGRTTIRLVVRRETWRDAA